MVDGEGHVVLLALVERVRGQLHRLPLRAVLQLEGQRVLRVELLATPLETEKGNFLFSRPLWFLSGESGDAFFLSV